MIYVAAILLAAGKGVRFCSKVPKPLAALAGKPLIAYSLSALNAHSAVRDIIVVVNPKNKAAIERIIRKSGINKIRAVVIGGRRRQDSVANALRALGPLTQLVLIHDAARPFIGRQLITALVKAAMKDGAAIPAVALKATVKAVDKTGCVQKTLDRDSIFEVQTPQAFKKGLILEAYRRFGKLDVTDDSSLVEKLEKKVVLVPGSYSNIKITTPEDMILAGCIVSKR